MVRTFSSPAVYVCVAAVIAIADAPALAWAQENPRASAEEPQAQEEPQAVETPVETAPSQGEPSVPSVEQAPVEPSLPSAPEPDRPADTTAPAGPSPREEARSGVEEIVVTGSRIRQNPLEKSQPILTLGADDLRRAGIMSVGDLLQRLPVSGGGINTRFNSSGNFGFPPDAGGVGAGSTQADLRYLGPKRVLVLVDGVRWVNGSSASGVPAATDLNSIPASIIERVEVLQDGASPIYGSDAIAGVINIITRQDFEGFAANASAGGYDRGDGVSQQYDVAWGGRADRLNIHLNLSYVKQDEIWSKDRATSRTAVPYLDVCTDSRCSSGTPQGRLVFTDPDTDRELDITLDDGTEVPVYDSVNPDTGGTYHTFTTPERFDYQPYNYILTPSDRFGIFSQVEYKLLSNVSVRAKALFNNRRSSNQAAPEPLFLGRDAGGGNRLDTAAIDATNPYNPFGFTLDGNSNAPFLTRRPLEAGPRIFRQNVDTWYVSGGLQGSFEILDMPFYWDATAIYSRNRADQVKTGAFNTAKLVKALGPVEECNADPACVPFNFFGGMGADGGGTITQEMLDYVTYVQHDLSEQQLWDFTANVTGDLFALPAGNVGVAVGFEHRRQSGFFEPDAIVSAGDSADVPAQPTSGKFNVNEAYAEIVVPLVADVFLLERLDVSGAVRASDYSTFGMADSYKAGIRWQPISDVLLRASYAQGFRAPGIGELFGSQSRYDQQLSDPCSDMLGLQSGGAAAPPEIQSNCRALEVPADGSYAQLNPQTSVTTGGNPKLDPETSDTYTASIVYSPSFVRETDFIDQLSIELTYYRIELDGAIQPINAQVQLDLCVRTLDPVLCNGIARTPSGVISSFANSLSNIGGIDTSGWDLALTYLSPETRAGRFRVTSITSILAELNERIPSSTGYITIERKGKETGDPPQAYPDLKSTLVAEWFYGPLRLSVTERYIHSVTESCLDLGAHPGTCSNPNSEDDSLSTNVLDATFYTDVQVGWSPQLLGNQLSVQAGVNNLFDRDPPACYSCNLNGFDPSTYDVPGMFGYVRIGYSL